VYRSVSGKYAAVVNETAEMHATGRPVLIGTVSIESSETLSRLLREAGIPHNVLNAKYEAQEASIVAQAGRSGQVTIATNMAGRGTDIMLGGNAEFMLGERMEGMGLSRYDQAAEDFIKSVMRRDGRAAELGALLPGITPEFVREAEDARDATEADRARVQAAGGLHIVGTERHESRRIDNQLRGRAGRQGDPGSSRFYVSFEDELMRLFANDRVVAMMDRLGMDDTQPIEAKMVTGAIERAQARVEDRNFSTRKQLLEFDNVMSKQRETVYAQRREVLLGPDADVEESTEGMILGHVDAQLAEHAPLDADHETWDLDALAAGIGDAIPALEGFEWEGLRALPAEEAHRRVIAAVADAFDERKDQLGPELLNGVSRYVLLQVVDQYWKEHLHGMDVLRQGIGLRGYGQRDPFSEYKFEATNMFNEMIDGLRGEVTKYLFRMQVGGDVAAD